MWILNNSALPTIPIKKNNAATIAILRPTNAGMAEIATLNKNLHLEQAGTGGEEPFAAVVILPAPANGIFEINVGNLNPTVVTAISTGGVIYQFAKNVDSPQPGEFTYNPATGIIRFYPGTQPIIPGMGLKIIGAIALPRKVPSDVVVGSYPEWLNYLPVTGDLSWDESFEGHPSGTLTIEVSYLYADMVRERFQPGTLLPLYHMELFVRNYTEDILPLSEYPEGLYVFNFSLDGKWAYYENIQSFYRKPIPGLTGTNSRSRELDPDCDVGGASANPANINTSTTGITSRALNEKPGMLRTTVRDLAKQIGADILGPRMVVEFPKDTPKEATTNWVSELKARVRQLKSYIDYSHPKFVRVLGFESGKHWQYKAEDILDNIQHSYQGEGKLKPLNVSGMMPPKPNPALFSATPSQPPVIQLREEKTDTLPKALYPVINVTSRFSETLNRDFSEDTRGRSQNQAEPKWKRVPSKRVSLTTGDINASSPPKGGDRITTMDLNFDQSGVKQEEVTTITEDGAQIRTVRKVYGTAYTGIEVIDSRGEINSSISSHWKLVEHEITEFLYDSTTGYGTGLDGTGWKLGRFKTESGSVPETVSLSGSGVSSTEARIAALYRFRKIPKKACTRDTLSSYRGIYKDSQDQPPYEQYKVCNPDGSSRIEYKKDPNWVEPMFVLEQDSQVNCFAKIADPESTPEDPLPPLTTGEESFTRKVIKVIPAGSNSDSGIGAISAQYDRFIEYNYQSSAQGASFRDMAEDGTFTENEGRPPAASRKPIVYERVEPEPDQGDDDARNTGKTQEVKFILSSPGYDPDGPEQGSVSYPHARTEQETLDAAETDLLIKDFKENVQTRFSVRFNPLLRICDNIRLIAVGTIYRRRVSSLSNSIHFEGSLYGKPVITSEGTKVGTGITRKLPFNMTKRFLPKSGTPPTTVKPPSPPNFSGGIRVISKGSLLSLDRNRRSG